MMSFFDRVQKLTKDAKSEIDKEYERALELKYKAWDEAIEVSARLGKTEAFLDLKGLDLKGWHTEWIRYSERLCVQGFRVRANPDQATVDWSRDYSIKDQ